MHIKDLKISDFRNLKQVHLTPSDNINVIYGENGQGKTNIIEAIWLCSGAKSFRNAKTSEFVQFNKNVCFIENSFYGFNREQQIKLKINNKKFATLNGVELDNSLKLAGNFCCVAFSPTHLSLVTDGPSERRKFIDSAICQFKPNYIVMLSRYKKVLSQKNSYLKNIKNQNFDNNLLDVYDKQLAFIGYLIYAQRNKYINRLKTVAKTIYAGISNDKEDLETEYLTPYNCNSEQDLFKDMQNAREREIKTGFSLKGPHRDDIDFKICSISAKTYGSQGQKRSCVLALKIAESEILTEIIGEKPIILLDDVLSELDKTRQDYLLNKITDRQVFITCCDEMSFKNLINGKLFHINSGEII